MKLLHIYAQEQWHWDARIVGNREALLALKEGIEKILEGSESLIPEIQEVAVEAFVNDGEGFDTIIELDDTPWEGETWRERKNPYTSEMAKAKD